MYLKKPLFIPIFPVLGISEKRGESEMNILLQQEEKGYTYGIGGFSSWSLDVEKRKYRTICGNR